MGSGGGNQVLFIGRGEGSIVVVEEQNWKRGRYLLLQVRGGSRFFSKEGRGTNRSSLLKINVILHIPYKPVSACEAESKIVTQSNFSFDDLSNIYRYYWIIPCRDKG